MLNPFTSADRFVSGASARSEVKPDVAGRRQAEAVVAPGSGARLSLRNVSKAYGGKTVLKHIDLDIAPGEFVAIVGRSGCGKSTLLRLMASLETASEGLLAATSATNDGASRAPQLRIMFQEARLLPWKKVLENVALGLKDRTRATAALDKVGLRERAGEWPAVLSGGQKQRVALARALVHDPDILLLDEPLGALDALTRIDMQQLIETLWQARGFTAALVTHDVQEAIALADRVLLIEDGEITLDQRIDLPRPRERGSVAFARLEADILARVLQKPAPEVDNARPHLPVSNLLAAYDHVRWAI